MKLWILSSQQSFSYFLAGIAYFPNLTLIFTLNCIGDRIVEKNRILLLHYRLQPFLNGTHHLEAIMYHKRIDRTTLTKIFDTFHDLIQTFQCVDQIVDEVREEDEEEKWIDKENISLLISS